MKTFKTLYQAAVLIGIVAMAVLIARVSQGHHMSGVRQAIAVAAIGTVTGDWEEHNSEWIWVPDDMCQWTWDTTLQESQDQALLSDPPDPPCTGCTGGVYTQDEIDALFDKWKTDCLHCKNLAGRDFDIAWGDIHTNNFTADINNNSDGAKDDFDLFWDHTRACNSDYLWTPSDFMDLADEWLDEITDHPGSEGRGACTNPTCDWPSQCGDYAGPILEKFISVFGVNALSQVFPDFITSLDCAAGVTCTVQPGGYQLPIYDGATTPCIDPDSSGGINMPDIILHTHFAIDCNNDEDDVWAAVEDNTNSNANCSVVQDDVCAGATVMADVYAASTSSPSTTDPMPEITDGMGCPDIFDPVNFPASPPSDGAQPDPNQWCMGLDCLPLGGGVVGDCSPAKDSCMGLNCGGADNPSPAPPGPTPPSGPGPCASGHCDPLAPSPGKHVAPDSRPSTPSPLSINPVHAAYGYKMESAVDLYVTLTGDDFMLTRGYSSQHDIGGAPLIGEHWQANVFIALEIAAGATPDLTLSTNSNGSTVYTHTSGKWWPVGPSTSYFEEGQLNTGGAKDWATWTLVEPGHWEVDFYREHAGDSTFEATPTDLIGLPLEQRDAYGNRRRFTYDTTNFNQPRLQRIKFQRVDSSTTITEAEAVFYWLQGSTNGGKLQGVDILRYPNGELSDPVRTQKVRYIYKGDTYFTPNPHAATGTTGDLIQVTRSALVDHDETQSVPSGGAFYKQVTQYRYHGGQSNETTDDDLDGFIEKGSDHQLKAVILPAQIEFAAEEYNAATGNQLDVEAFGKLLLAQTDDYQYDTNSPTIMGLAAKVLEDYETTGDKRILTQYIQSDCGCGGAAQGLKQEFTYQDYTTVTMGTMVVKRSMEIDESIWNATQYDAYRSLYYDLYADDASLTDPIFYLANYVIEDGTDRWVTHYKYDSSRRLERVFAPSATTTYVSNGASVPTHTLATTSGLAHKYEYNSGDRLTTVSVNQSGGLSSWHKIAETTWGSSGQSAERVWLPKKFELFRVGGSAAADNVETTEFEYGFHTSTGTTSTDVAWIQTRVEAELLAENGPSDAPTTPVYYYTHQILDEWGRQYWTRNADNCLTRFEFDTRTGQITEIEVNAPPDPAGTDDDFPTSDVPDLSSITNVDFDGRNGDGGSLETTYTYDGLGRITSITEPTGVTARYVRELRTYHEKQSLPYLAHVILPDYDDSGSPTEYNGPAIVSIRNAGGVAVQLSSFEMKDETTSPYKNLFTGYEFNIDTTKGLSRSTITYTYSGFTDSMKAWHSVAGDGEGSGVYTTDYEYDSLGRLTNIIWPTGSESGYVYDVLDRVTTLKEGIDNQTLDTVTVFEYDGGDVGNSNVTKITEKVDDTGSSGNDRATSLSYDHRDRLEVIDNETPPHAFIVYDHLDRATQIGLFKQVPSSISHVASTQDRVAYMEAHYSQRGLQYQMRVAEDPTAGTLAYLDTDLWYDENGTSIGQRVPGAPGTKITYNGFGAPDVLYKVDNENDDAGDEFKDFANVYDVASNVAIVTGDLVYEQLNVDYLAGTALPDMLTMRTRVHEALDTDTGALSDFTGGDADLVITTYAGRDLDVFARTKRIINFGTNTTGFTYGGTAPASSGTPKLWTTDSDDIIQSMTYNVRGLLDVITDPESVETRSLYDDLNRMIASVEAHDSADAISLTWNVTDDRWEIDSGNGLTASDYDKNRVTSVVYNGNGNITKQVAHFPDGSGNEDVQITEYIYDTEATGASGNSEIKSKDLLTIIRFPKAANPNQGTPDSNDQIIFGYNRLGELIYGKDQNNTVHDYSYDKGGRLTLDEATAGTGIDSSIVAIGVEYDDLDDGRGLPQFIRSYSSYTDPNTNTVANSVYLTYTKLFQPAKFYQKHDGDIDPQSLTGVQFSEYQYDTQDSTATGGNFSRIRKLIYPTADELELGFGLNSTPNYRNSRPGNLKVGGTRLVNYDYIGFGGIIGVDLSDIDVHLTRFQDHDGTSSTGSYPGLDRFGRVVKHMWVDGAFAGTGNSWPSIPSIVELDYTFDKYSTITSKKDVREGIALGARDKVYDYDDLYRLIQADWGVDGGSFTHSGDSKEWELDMLGNRLRQSIDGSASGVFDDASGDSKVEGDFNYSNEIDPDLTATVYGLSPDDYPFSYDDAGQMRTQRKASNLDHEYTWDSWGRLVSVERVVNPGGSPTTYDYYEAEYNGLNHRIKSRQDTGNIDGTLDEMREYYYSLSWQLLEEQVYENWSSETPGDVDTTYQNFWGLRYIDDAFMRRSDDGDGDFADAEDLTHYLLTDHQFSVIAVLDDSAEVVERIEYDAYGRPQQIRAHDYSGDFAQGASDTAIINAIVTSGNVNIGDTGTDPYRSEADFDRSAHISVGGDQIGSTKSALPTGTLSEVGNTIGYAGYIYIPGVQLYHVRHRCYDAKIGRWLSRDPAGYVDGANLYGYVGQNPIAMMDPTGLSKIGDFFYKMGHMAKGFGIGLKHGGAMWLNAATWHQIDSLDRYVDRIVAENGGVYSWANGFMHVSAFAAEAAGVVYLIGLVASKATIAVGTGKPIHFAISTAGRWMHAAGSWLRPPMVWQEFAYFGRMWTPWFQVSFPVFFPARVIATIGVPTNVLTCITAVISATLRGYFYWQELGYLVVGGGVFWGIYEFFFGDGDAGVVGIRNLNPVIIAAPSAGVDQLATEFNFGNTATGGGGGSGEVNGLGKVRALGNITLFNSLRHRLSGGSSPILGPSYSSSCWN